MVVDAGTSHQPRAPPPPLHRPPAATAPRGGAIPSSTRPLPGVNTASSRLPVGASSGAKGAKSSAGAPVGNAGKTEEGGGGGRSGAMKEEKTETAKPGKTIANQTGVSSLLCVLFPHMSVIHLVRNIP